MAIRSMLNKVQLNYGPMLTNERWDNIKLDYRQLDYCCHGSIGQLLNGSIEPLRNGSS